MRRITSVRINASSQKLGSSHIEMYADLGCTDSGLMHMYTQWSNLSDAIKRAKHGTYIMLEIGRAAK